MKLKRRLLKSGLGLAVVAVLAVAPTHNGRCEGDAEALPPAQGSTAARKALNAERVSFYRVPLACPAAPHIGCGSASKPLLVGLESNAAVSGAWLNRAGTIMAVVWSEQSTARQRSRIFKAALKDQIAAKELRGAVRKQALNDFQSGPDWYRGADVDRLSEEEAGIVAARWVGRIREKITVRDEQAQALQEGFAGAIRRKLTGQITRSEAQEAMLKVCRQHLEEKDVAVLVEAFKAEFQPPTRE
ncbi:MAG: hypothetical protein ABSH34_23630 [Verrucomicrobiota bacterium]|jgi:hypothetical protein